jgi:hypothetical protein
LPPEEAKGVELSRVSGDLVFTDEDESSSSGSQDSEKKRAAEKLKRENV